MTMVSVGSGGRGGEGGWDGLGSGGWGWGGGDGCRALGERKATGLGRKSVGGCYSAEMRRPVIRSTAHEPILRDWIGVICGGTPWGCDTGWMWGMGLIYVSVQWGRVTLAGAG